MNWLDILIIIIIGLGAFKGFVRGLIGSFFGLAAFIASWGLAAFYTSDVVQFLKENTNWSEKIVDKVEGIVPMPQGIGEASWDSLDVVGDSIWQLPLPQAFKESLISNLEEASTSAIANTTATVGQYLNEVLADFMLFALVFIGILIGVRLLLNLLARFIRGWLVGGAALLDRLAGLAFGGLEAVLILTIVFGLITPFLGMPMFETLKTAVNASDYAQYLIKIFYLISPWTTSAQGMMLR